MKLCENLKAARTKKGLTQKQVSEIAGVSESLYCQYEGDKRVPRASTLHRIAKALEVEYQDLITEGSNALPSGGTVSFINDPDSDNYQVDIRNASADEIVGVIKTIKPSVDDLVGFYEGLKNDNAPMEVRSDVLDLIIERATEFLGYAVSEKSAIKK